jgi:hypothetical protein
MVTAGFNFAGTARTSRAKPRDAAIMPAAAWHSRNADADGALDRQLFR